MSLCFSALVSDARLSLLGALLALNVASGEVARAQEQAKDAGAGAQTASVPTVAAAASLRYALDEIAARYKTETGKEVRITFGSTGNLVAQIENAAPFQVLFAADDKSVKKLASEGRTDGEPIIFARGRLAVAAPIGSPVSVDPELKGLKAAIAAGNAKHISIANWETAPYGRAAREALQKAGILKDAEPLFVIGENVGQAATFVSTGAAQVGLIAYSLAVSKELSSKITSAVVPADWHQQIDHGLAVIKGASADAKAFVEFVRGPQGAKVLEANGFSVPTS